MKRLLKIMCLMLLLAGYSGSVFGQVTYTWTPVLDPTNPFLTALNWADASNWTASDGTATYPNSPNHDVNLNNNIIKCIVNQDVQCGDIKDGQFDMVGNNLSVHGDMSNVEEVLYSGSGSVLIIGSNPLVALKDVKTTILQIKKDDFAHVVKIGSNVVVSDELILSQGFVSSTPTGNYEEVKNLIIDADGASPGKSTLKLAGNRDFILKGTTPSKLKVVSGELTITSGNRIILSGTTNYEQSGGKIIGATAGNLLANKAAYPIVFSGAADATISGTAINIEASVLIDKAAGNKVSYPSGASTLNIGTPTNPKNFMISGGVFENNNNNPVVVGDFVVVENGQYKVITTNTKLQVLGDFRTNEFDVSNTFTPFDLSSGIDGAVQFVGSGDNIINVSGAGNVKGPGNEDPAQAFDLKNTQFGTITLNAATGFKKTVTLDPTSGPLIINQSLTIFENAKLLINNVTNDTLHVKVKAPGNNLFIPIPAADVFIHDLIVESNGTFDAYTNEPTDASNGMNKTISIFITNNLIDNNNELPTKDHGFYASSNLVSGKLASGKGAADNNILPTVVFYGINPQNINGANLGIRNIDNSKVVGLKGLYLPHVYVVKPRINPTDLADKAPKVSVEAGKGIKVMGLFQVLTGNFVLNPSCKMYYGNDGRDAMSIYGVFTVMPSSSIFLANTTTLEIKRGGYGRFLGTKSGRINIERDGNRGRYYRSEVEPGGMIDVAYTSFLYQIGKNPGYYHPGGATPTSQDEISLGGTKMHFGSIINPKHGSVYDPILGTSPDCPQYPNNASAGAPLQDIPYNIVSNGESVFYNFSYCNFAQGANNYTALTINTGQELTIVGAKFTGPNSSKGSFKNVSASPQRSFDDRKTTDPPGADKSLTLMGLLPFPTPIDTLKIITMERSFGRLGGVNGEGYDSGQNDKINPLYDRIVWNNFPPIYWVGSYSGTNFATPTHSGSKTDWANWRNWSISNTSYENPGKIYPGQTTLTTIANNKYKRDWPGGPDDGMVPADTLKQFDVFITHTSATATANGSKPTLSQGITIFGSVNINSGVEGIYYVAKPGINHSTQSRLQRMDLSPQVFNNKQPQILTLVGNNTLKIKGALNITTNGQQGSLIVLDNGTVMVGQNVYSSGVVDYKGGADVPATYGNLILDGLGEQEMKCTSSLDGLIIDKPDGRVIAQNRVRAHNFTMKQPDGGSSFRISSGSEMRVKKDVKLEGGVFIFDQSPVTVGHNWINTGGFVDTELLKDVASVIFKGEDYDAREHIVTTNGQPFPQVIFKNNTVLNKYTITDGMSVKNTTTVETNVEVKTQASNNVLIKTEGMYVEGLLDLTPSTSVQITTPAPIGTSVFEVAATGTLKAIGSATEYVKITRDGIAGHYKFNIKGKNSIRFFNIQFTDENGVDLRPTGTSLSPGITEFGGACPELYVGSFSDGSFSNGKDVPNATYLNLPAGYQTQDIHNTNFPLALSAGSNVKRLDATGNQPAETVVLPANPVNVIKDRVVFINATGVFAGEGFDEESTTASWSATVWPPATVAAPQPDSVIVWSGAIKRWTGLGGDNKWSTADNWTGNSVPTVLEAVILDHEHINTPYTVVIDASYVTTPAQCRDLTVVSNTGAKGAINVNLTQGGKIDIQRSSPCGGTSAVDYGGDYSADAPSTFEVLDKGTAATASYIKVGKSWSNAGTFVYGPAGSEATVNFNQPTGSRIITTGAKFSHFYNVILEEGYSENNDNLFVDKNFTIKKDAIYDASDIGGIELHVGGDWLNNGKFLPKLGTVFFDGSGPQTLTKNIPGGSLNDNTETFYNLNLNKVDSDPNIPSQLTLNSRIYVDKLTRFTEGIINSSEDKELIIGNEGSWDRVTSPVAAKFGFVNGPVGIIFKSKEGLSGWKNYPIGVIDKPYQGKDNSGTEGYSFQAQLNNNNPTTFTMEVVYNDPEDQDGDNNMGPDNNGALHYNDYTESSVGSVRQVAGARILPQPFNMVSKDIFYRVRNIGYPTADKDDDLVPDLVKANIGIIFNINSETSQQIVDVNGVNHPLNSSTDAGAFVQDVSILQDYDKNTDPSAVARGAASSKKQIRRGRAASGTHWRDLGGIPDLTANTARLTSSITFNTLGNGQFTIGWYFVPLPVEFVQLTAEKVGQQVQLSWITENETGIEAYIVERRFGKGEFRKIASVDATDDASSIKKYTAFDKSPLVGINYYRLKYTDGAGTSYSKIVAVQFDKDDFADTAKLVLYPNPTNANHFMIRFVEAVDAEVSVHVMDMIGNKVFDATYQVSGDLLKVEPNAPLKAGVYLIKVMYKQQQIIKRLVVTD